MKNYLRPLRSNGKNFKVGATFEEAYEYYKFDSKLRKLISSELEKIEVSFRTQLSLIMAERCGEFWFSDATNFKSANKHSELLTKLHKENERSDDDAIINFKNNFSNQFPHSWMTMEVTSFGTLSILYKLLDGNGLGRRELAHYYGLSDRVLELWLHSLVYMRNICANHGKLWNRNFGIMPLTPRRPRMNFLNTTVRVNRAYYAMSVMLYFLKTVNPNNTFVAKFKSLLSQYQMIDIAAMRFPQGWETEPLWR